MEENGRTEETVSLMLTVEDCVCSQHLSDGSFWEYLDHAWRPMLVLLHMMSGQVKALILL